MCSRRTSDGLIVYSGMDLVRAGGTFQNYWGPIFACPDCNCHWSSNVCSNPDCAQHGKRIPGESLEWDLFKGFSLNTAQQDAQERNTAQRDA